MPFYGYIRTSKQVQEGVAGMDPFSQQHRLREAGVGHANIFRDIGASGSSGTNERRGWRNLDNRISGGDTLVVVRIDRIGRVWLDVLNNIVSLRSRAVKIRSLDPNESWTQFLELDSDDPMAFAGHQMVAFAAWVADRERQINRQRTIEGQTAARAKGKTIGRPKALTDDQIEWARTMQSEKTSIRRMADIIGVNEKTLRNALKR